ncbi:MAG: hypothetical protein ABSD96_05645 [Candidatus Korobacteraceae bacterium]
MRIRAQLVCASLLLAGSVPALPGQTPSKPASTRPSAAAPASAQTSISAPAETAAQPPKVTYSDGLLGIRAENSTLGDVLKAVQSATGASIDSPGFASERVYVNLGPGEPRDILASLLNGSRYDYILLGSQQQPNSVARVMLTVRQTSHEQPVVSSTAAVQSPVLPQRLSPHHLRPGASADDDDTADTPPDREAAATLNQPGQPVPEQPAPNTVGAVPLPGQQPNAQQANGQSPFGQPLNGQPVKTPEQLLRDLQQLQQQQQQQLQLQQQLQQQNNFGH